MDYIRRTELFDYLRNKSSQPYPFGLIPEKGKISIDAENRTIIEFDDLRFNLFDIDNWISLFLLEPVFRI